MLKELLDFILKTARSISQKANYWLGLKNNELFSAVKLGNTSLVIELLAQGTHINCKNNEGNTPLHIAAQNGYMQIVEHLLEHKATLNAENYHKDTPLHLAASAGNTAAVLLLLEKGAILNARNKDNNTPFHVAVNNGKLDTLVSLINYSQSTDSTQYNDLLKHAVISEKIDIMSWLIKTHPNKNNIDIDKLLMISIKSGKFESLRFLMSSFPNITKSHLNDLVNLAVKNFDMQSVNLLMNYGADINNAEKPILTVVKNGQIDLFRNLIALGANLHVNDSQGNNAIHFAAQSENYSMLKEILIKSRLNPKATNIEGQTPKDILEEMIQQLLVQLNQHKLDHIICLKKHIKNHHLETEKLIQAKDYAPDVKKIIYKNRAQILTNEVGAIKKLAQHQEALLTAKIQKLDDMVHLLSQAQTQFHQNFITTPQMTKPSAPPINEQFMIKNPALGVPYYNNLNKDKGYASMAVGKKEPLLNLNFGKKLRFS